MANGRNPPVRRTRTVGGKRFRMTIEYRSDVPEGVKALEKFVQETLLRSAAYAGAKVFYDEMRARVPVKSGELRDAIYHWHDDGQSTQTRQVYMIGPNKVKAGHWHHIEFGHYRYNKFAPSSGGWLKSKYDSGARTATPGMPGGVHIAPGALDIPEWVPPVPFVRPTWTSQKDYAVQRMILRMRERFDELRT